MAKEARHIRVYNFMDVADILNDLENVFVEIEVEGVEYLAFVNVRNRLTIRAQSDFDTYDELNVTPGNITESDIENLIDNIASIEYVKSA